MVAYVAAQELCTFWVSCVTERAQHGRQLHGTAAAEFVGRTGCLQGEACFRFSVLMFCQDPPVVAPKLFAMQVMHDGSLPL
jgi:hypothetical protein